MAIMNLVRKTVSKVLPHPRGYVDHSDLERIAGWAHDPDRPGASADVNLFIDGQLVMTARADLPREDVTNQRNLPVRCGFEIALPPRLRDGRTHVVEVRLAPDGPRLRGGRLRMSLDSAVAGAGMGENTSSIEGVAWFDRGRMAVTGWATGAAKVSLSVDGGAKVSIPLTQEVPGLGAGNRQGFRYVLPDDYADGRPHDVEVRAGDWLNQIPLDGSPVNVIVGAERPKLSVTQIGPRRICLILTDRDGQPHEEGVDIHLDGVLLAPEPSTPDELGQIILDLPESARRMSVATRTHGAGEATPAYIIGRFVIGATGDCQDWSADVPDAALDLVPLSSDLIDRACAAFSQFVEAPDARFDESWLAIEAGLSPGVDVLSYWVDHVASDGLSPGPTFDESAARDLHPNVARAIAENRLPCAFALELALGSGSLGALDEIARKTGAIAHRVSDPAAPIEPELPVITAHCDPDQSIYAAWLARLSLPEHIRSQIEENEVAARSHVAYRNLSHAPLVSIIMPSWNRAFTIGEAIQSVLEQSYENWELLICDDASEDRTADVVRGFDDGRIRYMQFQKSNGAGARNHGLRHARGTYIAYLDSDNMWHPLFLDRMLRQLMEMPGRPLAYSAYLDTEVQGADVVLHEISSKPFRPVQLSGKNFMDLNSIVHHRRVLDWLGGFDGALPRLQDWDLMLRYTSVFGAQHVDFIGVFYRRNIAWGQVTHTQHNSGAQDTVNRKTQDRLDGAIERLKIEWPGPSRATVLCGSDSFEDRALAVGLARMCKRFGRVDLVSFSPLTTMNEASDIECRLLSKGAVSLDAQIADLADAPLISVGLSIDALRTLRSVPSDRVFTPEQRLDGIWLSPVDRAAPAFPLGSVDLAGVLDLRRASAGPAALLVLDAANPSPNEKLQTQAVAAGVRLIYPPAQDRGGWAVFDNSGLHDVGSESMLEASACVVTGGRLADLSPFQFALLDLAMAAGIPVALTKDRDLESLSSQWIDARAAYEIKSSNPEWLIEKLSRLVKDQNAIDLLAERGNLAHRIAMAPALADQRMAHFLWRIQFDPPLTEVFGRV